MEKESVMSRLLAQVKKARHDLDKYPPSNFQWFDRCVLSTKLLSLHLGTCAIDLKKMIEDTVNSRQRVLNAWSDLLHKAALHIPQCQIGAMYTELKHEELLLRPIGRKLITDVAKRFLVRKDLTR